MPANKTRRAAPLAHFWTRWGLTVGWVLLLAFVVVALDQRCHAFFVNPDLRAEDGKSVFAFFYKHRELRRLWRVKAGYVPLMPNILGYIAVRLPPRSAPYFMTLVPVVFTVAVFSVFRASAFRRHAQSDRLRVCCCLAVALVPIGTFFLVCHTDYSIWNLFVLLLWLVLLPMPEGKWRAALLVVLMTVLIWSHPLSVAAVPPTLYWLWADKGLFNRTMHALVLCTQAIHVVLGTHTETTRLAHGKARLLERGLNALETCWHICIETLSSTLFPYAEAISPRLAQTCAVGLLVGLVACAVLPIKLHVSRALLLWILYCIVVPHLMVVLVRQNGLHSSRYVYVMRLYALVGWCILLWEGLTYLASKLQRFLRLRALNWLPEIVVLAFCTSLVRPGTNAAYKQQTPGNGRVIQACFARLDKLQRERGTPCDLWVPCWKKGGDWAFVIDSRKACED